MSRLRGILLIALLIGVGFAVNQLVFQAFEPGGGHSTHRRTPTVSVSSTPLCTVTEVVMSNVSVSNYFVGSYVLSPLTPFVKTLIVRRPSIVSMSVSGENVSSIRVFIAIENRGSLTIESPQLYEENDYSVQYEALVPPGLVSIVVMNVYDEPIRVHIVIEVKNSG